MFFQANTFNILNSGVNLLMLMIILPLASFLLLRCCGYTTFRKDLVLAHISNFLFIAGALVLSIAPEVSAAVTGKTLPHLDFSLTASIKLTQVSLSSAPASGSAAFYGPSSSSSSHPSARSSQPR
jgi:hypothetical protein